ncbi:MAG TPA: ribosome silencing factor [Acidimicrobiia bacterium]
MTSPPADHAHRRAAIAAATAAAKKAADISVLDVGDIISITDVFVIASGANTRQVRTIVDEVEKALRERTGDSPRSVEGLDDASWVLLDYGDVVVHVFLAETRAYYDLDRLWADAPRVDWEETAAVS